MARTKARSGKLLTGIIAFLLGFIFAIIVEVGVIVGAGFLFLNTPIDDLFAMVNQKNEDVNGNQYIDTTGEIKTVLDLINEIRSILGDQPANATIGSLVKLSPALDAQLREWYEMAEGYGIYVDASEINALRVGDLSDYIVNSFVPAIQPYSIIKATNPDGLGSNELLRAILLGTEADYVLSGSQKYVVYYDQYIPSDEGYVRVVDGRVNNAQSYPSNLADGLLTKTNAMLDEQYVYRQYYYFDSSAQSYTAVKADEEGAFEYVPNEKDNLYPEGYGEELNGYTGNYLEEDDGSFTFLKYTDSDGKEKDMTITVGSFTGSSTFDLFTLDFIEVDDMLADFMGESEIISSLFDGVTLGELMDGNFEFDARVQNFDVTAIIEISPDDAIMAYLGYGITGIEEAADEEYPYTATHKFTDESGKTQTEQVFIALDEKGNIAKVVNAAGEEIAPTKVSEISDKVNDLDVTVFIDVAADDAVMAYLGYGITSVSATDDPAVYTAEYKDENGYVSPCTVYVTQKDGKPVISKVVRDDTGEQLLPATVEELSDRISGITDNLALADFIDVNPSYEDEAGEVVNNNIMLFVGFSATMQPGELKTDALGSYYEGRYYPADNDEGLAARIYIDDASAPCGEQKVVRVEYTEDGSAWAVGAKTSINGVSDQISRLTSVLTVGDIITIDEGDRLMTKLGAYPIDEIGDAIDTICVSDAVDIGTDEDIMLYVAFGITEVRENGGVWLAAYHPLSGDEAQTVFLVMDKNDEGKEIVVGIIDGEGNAVEGTTISGVGERVGRLTEDLALTSVIDIDGDDAIMMYIGYSVSGISTDEDNITTGKYSYTDEDGTHQVSVIIEKDENGNAQRVYYISDGVMTEVPGTKIADIGKQVDGLTATLTIDELIEINPDDRILSLVADSTIDGLSDTIAAITVQDMYADTIYESSAEADENGWITVTESNFDAAYLYYTIENGKYVLVNGDGRLTAFDELNTYYTRGKATGIWYLLLYSNGSEQVYFINELGDMMNNATENMTSSTLQDFKDAGIITAELSQNSVPVRIYTDGDVLGPDETVKEAGGVSYVVKPLNLCTIDELIEAVNILAGMSSF